MREFSTLKAACLEVLSLDEKLARRTKDLADLLTYLGSHHPVVYADVISNLTFGSTESTPLVGEQTNKQKENKQT